MLMALKMAQNRGCFGRRTAADLKSGEIPDSKETLIMSAFTLSALNTASQSEFVAAVGDVFEHAPWVAEAAFAQRPFATVAALHQAMAAAVQSASPEAKLAFLRGHPELAARAAPPGGLTADSSAEQGSLGLRTLSETEFARFERANRVYREKFGFPFIICVRRHTRASVLREFERRTHNSVETELAAALNEIGFITRLRLVAKVDGPGKPATTGRLSTHVLDTWSGRPAVGVKITLTEIGDEATALIASGTTNDDGRTPEPFVSGAPLRIGRYRIDFHVGDYFAALAAPRSDPAFLDVVPVAFAIADPEGHYHVPLLVTPWSYATYRGS
jgi:2-oxo-4-hydroxy-4-carboxy-5-ureidoimidazoline decarboxylase